MHEATKQPDRLQSVTSMQKELEDNVLCKHWKLIPLWSLPTNKRPLPMVCSMKRKRNPLGEIKNVRLVSAQEATNPLKTLIIGQLIPPLSRGAPSARS